MTPQEQVIRKYGTFAKLRTAINNEVYKMVNYRGQRGRDHGDVLDEAISRHSSTDEMKSYIWRNFHK